MLAEVCGQKAAEKIFLETFYSGKFHHAWLLTGERGIGKATFAYAAARFLLSNTNSQAKQCKERGAMPINIGEKRVDDAKNGNWYKTKNRQPSINLITDKDSAAKVVTKSHPDLFILEAEKSNSAIKVDAARELSNFAALTPALGERKVIIIDSVNDLNDNAANALLKLLEEPQDNTFFLLICHSSAAILPTIQSRCQKLRLLPLEFQDFYQVIASRYGIGNKPDEWVREVYKLAKGSMHYAKLLLQEGGLDIYRLAEDLLLSGKPNARNLKKLMVAVDDDDNWEIAKFAFQSTARKIITDAAITNTLSEKQMEASFKRLQLLQEADAFYLDRSQLVVAFSHQMAYLP